MTEEQKIAKRDSNKKYYQKNKDKIIINVKKYYQENKDFKKEYARLYNSQNKERLSQINKDKREYTSEQERARYKTDIQYRLKRLLRGRMFNAIQRQTKTGSTIKDLGCSIADFKIYLENRFTDGMSWNNQGKWHLDHIVPLASVDLTDRKQFLKVCHYTNMQPLWAKDNLSKGSKI